MIENFKLSNRLQKCADMVTKNSKIADIGTDHAYLPIYLALNKKISFALACDLREGPLKIAQKNISSHNLSGIISTRISDGLENINENEVDEIIIAGMGGNMIVNILKNCSWKDKISKKFILQPMKYENRLRKFLYENGYKIEKEEAVICSEKVYTAMLVKFIGKKISFTPEQEYIGAILDNKNSEINFETKAYLRKQIKDLKNHQKGAISKQNKIQEKYYGDIISSLEKFI